MIYDVAKIIATEIAARGCPLPVVYGPERMPSGAESRIVIERPRSLGDTTGPPRVTKNNPPRRAERKIVGKVRVYARSTVDGARVNEHEALADQAVDLVIVAFEIAVARLRLATATIGAGGFVDDPAAEAWAGVTYEFPITVQRSVFDRTWAGASKDTIALTGNAITGCITAEPDPDP